MINTPLDVERFQLAVVLSKALLLHELLNIWVGLPVGKKRKKQFQLLSYLWCWGHTVVAVSPAGEVDLITPQVNVGVGEHRADLLEEPFHEFICSVQNGIYWAEGARRFGAGVTGC